MHRFASVLALAALATTAQPALSQTSDLVSKTELRVCADPANVPVSDESGSGFENRIADLLANDLGVPLVYTWFPVGPGFLNRTLLANRCDVLIGFAQGGEIVLNTNHYYTSGYLLIVPKDGDLAKVSDLSDPALQGKRIGVIAGSPPATHMVRHGLMAQAKGYDLMVDRRVQSPSEDMLADLEAGNIDAAILWGPIGGPLVKSDHPDLKGTLLLSEPGAPKLYYRITMGVRPNEKVWQRKLNSLIRRDQDKIDAILTEAGVPLLNDMGTAPLDVSN
ncbi:MAG: substrate-binding domain-containing protein [Rhodobacteraceae bacterium]|nr:substrate-binding domain-containing protein [Paracoccaceae bacterium]